MEDAGSFYPYCQVLETHCEPAGKNPNGEVTWAYMTLRGKVLPVIWDQEAANKWNPKTAFDHRYRFLHAESKTKMRQFFHPLHFSLICCSQTVEAKRRQPLYQCLSCDGSTAMFPIGQFMSKVSRLKGSFFVEKSHYLMWRAVFPHPCHRKKLMKDWVAGR